MTKHTAKQGRDKILMFRKLSEAGKKAAARLAFQVEHTLNYERQTDSTMTKDGAVVTSGGLTVSADITAVSSNDPLNKMLKESVIKGEKLEVWEIDLSDKKESGKYGALYWQGALESWEVPANVEGTIELSTTMAIDGQPQEGEATITEEQEQQIAYAFRDVTIVPGV